MLSSLSPLRPHSTAKSTESLLDEMLLPLPLESICNQEVPEKLSKLRRHPNDFRVLDLDIETRLVGFHKGGRFNPDGCEPIAIAWSFYNSQRVESRQLGVDAPEQMLLDFVAAFHAANMVTGHYLRKFDLPIINAALAERGLPLLGPKLVSDTKLDLKNISGISKKQENLAEMLALAESKYHMTDVQWRKASRLTPDGITETARRVRKDVRQHKLLRAALVQAKLLNPPKVWQ